MSHTPFEMNRSQGQISRAYSPGSLFTFEGGAVACKALPDQENREVADALSEANKRQIAGLIQEYVSSWLARAQGGTNPRHPIPARLCVDRSVLNELDAVDIRIGNLRFQVPEYAGYEPFPLSFRCTRCGLHREARSPDTLAQDMAEFRRACPTGEGGCADNWRQLDFVMAHWSGGVESPSPRRLERSVDGNTYSVSRCAHCEGERFRWLGIGTGSLSAVRFACVDCNNTRDLIMKDPDTLRELGPDLDAGRALYAEVNMEPISYRASATHYPHGDRVLLFADEDRMRLLEASREADLAGRLREWYGFPTGGDLPEERKRELLSQSGRLSEWDLVNGLRQGLAGLRGMNGMEAAVQAMEAQIAQREADWVATVFAQHLGPSAGLRSVIDARTRFPGRFDPVRMAVEHAAFRAEKISAGALEDGRLRSVPVDQLDEFTRPDGLHNPGDLDRVHAASREWLNILGIAEMRIVRDVRVCEFTFGYTRTSSLPLTERRSKAQGVDLPVKLRMFPQVQIPSATSGGIARWKHPVLCVVSSNEGIYVRLDSTAVEAWIAENDLDLPSSSPGLSLGARLLEQAAATQVAGSPGAMTPFLDEFRREEEVPELAYPHVVTLLHTISHQVIQHVSALSGLDQGSFSEYLFAPDLAFLVYRRGTTMDLGNISSMWRDRGSIVDGNEFLARMGGAAALRCGSESSCTHKGGACPDCVMIPETSCITRNDLLSRSALAGRGKPGWARWNGAPRREMVGYYDVVARIHAATTATGA